MEQQSTMFCPTAAALMEEIRRVGRGPFPECEEGDCALLGGPLQESGLLKDGPLPQTGRELLIRCRHQGTRAAGPYRRGDLVCLRPPEGGERVGLVERDHGLDVTVLQASPGGAGSITWPKRCITAAVRPPYGPEGDPLDQVLEACLARWLSPPKEGE